MSGFTREPGKPDARAERRLEPVFHVLTPEGRPARAIARDEAGRFYLVEQLPDARWKRLTAGVDLAAWTRLADAVLTGDPRALQRPAAIYELAVGWAAMKHVFHVQGPHEGPESSAPSAAPPAGGSRGGAAEAPQPAAPPTDSGASPPDAARPAMREDALPKTEELKTL